MNPLINGRQMADGDNLAILLKRIFRNTRVLWYHKTSAVTFTVVRPKETTDLLKKTPTLT